MTKSIQKPFVLGLDLDEVCAEYNKGFKVYVAKAKGLDPDTLLPPIDWDFTKVGWGIKTNDEFRQLHADAIKEGMFYDLEPVKDCRDVLWRLSDAGVHIRIITHRLVINNLHGKIAGDTVAWLDKVEIPYRDICMIGAKENVNADLYVDDGPHNILALRAKEARAVIYDRPHNRFLEGERVNSWLELETVVKKAAGL